MMEINETWNGRKPFVGNFRYFKLLYAPLPVTIRWGVNGCTNQLTNVLPGRGFRAAPGEPDFGRLEIINPVNQLIIAEFSDGDSINDRVVGEVSVINGERSRTIADIAFFSYNGIGGAAAKYSHCQLWNPAASGKKLVVEQIIVSSPANTEIQLGSYNAQLLTASAEGGVSKRIVAGAAASVAEQRRETNAAILITKGFADFLAAASQPVVIRPTEPIIIYEGWGLNVVNLTVNVNVYATFEFYEEAA